MSYPASYTKQLNDLRAKLDRQERAVASTLEMIELLERIQAQDIANAKKLTEQKTK